MRRCNGSGREVLEPHKLGSVCERGFVFFRGEGRMFHSGDMSKICFSQLPSLRHFYELTCGYTAVSAYLVWR